MLALLSALLCMQVNVRQALEKDTMIEIMYLLNKLVVVVSHSCTSVYWLGILSCARGGMATKEHKQCWVDPFDLM